MVWAAFSKIGTLELQLVSKKMNSSDYINVLQCSLIPFMNKNKDREWVFQQDNASIHVSKQSLGWLRSKKIKYMDWPACSPDLNPIENLWGILTRRVYGNNRQFDSVEELKLHIIREWQNLDQNLLNSLVESMPNRIFECININGALTKN